MKKSDYEKLGIKATDHSVELIDPDDTLETLTELGDWIQDMKRKAAMKEPKQIGKIYVREDGSYFMEVLAGWPDIGANKYDWGTVSGNDLARITEIAVEHMSIDPGQYATLFEEKTEDE